MQTLKTQILIRIIRTMKIVMKRISTEMITLKARMTRSIVTGRWIVTVVRVSTLAEEDTKLSAERLIRDEASHAGMLQVESTNQCNTADTATSTDATLDSHILRTGSASVLCVNAGGISDRGECNGVA